MEHNKYQPTPTEKSDNKIIDIGTIKTRTDLNKIYDILIDKSTKLSPQKEKILVKEWFKAQTPVQALTDATSNIDLMKLIIKFIPNYAEHLEYRPTILKMYQQISDLYGYKTEAS